MKRSSGIFAVSLVTAVFATTQPLAQTAADAGARAGADAETGRGGTLEQNRLSEEFVVFAGSQANSRNLVMGLRNAQAITLTGNEVSGRTDAAVTFTPPTRPMGWGNVSIALAIAQRELAVQGITSPTPQRLQAALMGGSIAVGNPPHKENLQGVLQLRSQGMGWGRIAKVYGFKLGPIVAGTKSTSHAEFTTGQRSHAGIRTAAGASSELELGRAGHEESRGIVTSAGTVTPRPGQGITTAAGASGHSGFATAPGRADVSGFATGQGVSTAIGASGQAGFATNLGRAGNSGLAGRGR